MVQGTTDPVADVLVCYLNQNTMNEEYMTATVEAITGQLSNQDTTVENDDDRTTTPSIEVTGNQLPEMVSTSS